MPIMVYSDGANCQEILSKSVDFVKSIFRENPNIETFFIRTTKGFEVMISKEDGKITGYWNSEKGHEDYSELRSFLEIHKLAQIQDLEEILDSAY